MAPQYLQIVFIERSERDRGESQRDIGPILMWRWSALSCSTVLEWRRRPKQESRHALAPGNDKKAHILMRFVEAVFLADTPLAVVIPAVG